MFSIEYEDWKCMCLEIFTQKSGRKRMYLQWYPFTKLLNEEKDILISEKFFRNYIKTGLFLYYDENWIVTNNYINSQRDILLRETAKVILQNNTLAITSKEPKLATLNALKSEGVYWIDAVKYPINKIDKKLRKQAIQAGVPDLMAKITTLQPEKIIIVMKSVYDLVAQALQKAGLPVVGMLIYSPFTPAPQGLDYKTRLKQALEFTKQG